MLVWWGCLCLVEYGTVEWQRGQINVTMMPTELLRSARFSFAAFPSSKNLGVLSHYYASGACTHEQTEGFLLSITWCFFYPCCQWHTPSSPIGLSLLFWTPQPSRVSGGKDSSVSMLRANCRSQTFIVTLRFWAETLHFCFTWKMNVLSDFRMLDVTNSLSLPPSHTYI